MSNIPESILLLGASSFSIGPPFELWSIDKLSHISLSEDWSSLSVISTEVLGAWFRNSIVSSSHLSGISGHDLIEFLRGGGVVSSVPDGVLLLRSLAISHSVRSFWVLLLIGSLLVVLLSLIPSSLVVILSLMGQSVDWHRTNGSDSGDEKFVHFYYFKRNYYNKYR